MLGHSRPHICPAVLLNPSASSCLRPLFSRSAACGNFSGSGTPKHTLMKPGLPASAYGVNRYLASLQGPLRTCACRCQGASALKAAAGSTYLFAGAEHAGILRLPAAQIWRPEPVQDFWPHLTCCTALHQLQIVPCMPGILIMLHRLHQVPGLTAARPRDDGHAVLVHQPLGDGYIVRAVLRQACPDVDGVPAPQPVVHGPQGLQSFQEARPAARATSEMAVACSLGIFDCKAFKCPLHVWLPYRVPRGFRASRRRILQPELRECRDPYFMLCCGLQPMDD